MNNKQTGKLRNGQEDDFLQKIIEQENAFLNPEEWGIYLAPVVKEHLNPPQDKEKLDDAEIRYYLPRLIHMLTEHHLCLTNTNHLDDRQLYVHILEQILPQPIEIGPNPAGGILYHECCPCDDFDRWLAYYATDEEREEWAREWKDPLPDKLPLASDRDTWIEILAESFRDQPLPDYSKVT